MAQLVNAENDRLVAIFDMIYNQKATFENFLKEQRDVKKARNYVIKKIKEGLKQTNYDGSLNNTESIYWFAKGLNEHPQPLNQKYDYAPLEEDLYKKIDELIHLRPKAKEYYGTKTPKKVIDNIPNVASEDSDILKKKSSYREYFTQQDEKEQERLVNAKLDKILDSPEEWEIYFDDLNDYGRQLIFPELKKFLEEKVMPLVVADDYKLQFSVNGEWHSKPLTPEVFRDLLSKFTVKNFLFDIEIKNMEVIYDKRTMALPRWSLFSAIKFNRCVRTNGYRDVGGHFLKYLIDESVPQVICNYLIKLQIFDSLVDERNKQRHELDDCCFIYALTQTGCYSEEELNQIRLRVQNRYLSQSSINKLCDEFKIHINLTNIDEEFEGKNKKKSVATCKEGNRKYYMGVAEAESNRIHKLNIYQKHYFIEEPTPISTYYAKNWKEINDETKFDKILQKQQGKKDYWRKARNFISSSNLVRLLFQQNCFKPITYGEYSILNTIYYKEIHNDISKIKLEFNEEYCCRLIAPRKYKATKQKDEITYWYADFESDTSGEIHHPFMVVVHSEDGKKKEEFRGIDCGKQLLNYLPNNSMVYFHNLAYDIRFLASYGINKSIIKGNKMMTTDIKYKSKTIHFKDSLPILSCKLSQLPKMFDIQNIQKEIFPYKYYTFERLQNGIGEIDTCGDNEDTPWTIEDYKLFKKNVDSIEGCRIDKKHFDMWKYCSFYCQQDVNILRIGFNKFREGFMQDFGIDPYRFISISSLANEVFNKRVYYNHNLYQIGGVVRKFCSHAVYGGRCMTAYNKKWHTKEVLCDFDAVSLYPSAMSRLYTVQGKPQVISKEQLNFEFLSKQGAYIVEIKITKINKHYAFPLIVKKTKDGNLNDDRLNDGEYILMVVDNITLEDLIEFQKIEFEILRGYYWEGERDYTIQGEIRKIFEKRLEYKKQGNPLQQLYKLIMNSCYGKTIERPIEKDYKYFKEGDELNKYWQKNYNKIVEDIKIENNGKTIHAVKTLRPIDQHFNFSLLGIQVLSMSKRIMNEVMCLAFDIGCKIYYQDTDSFMIEKADLERLEKVYNDKYDRKLIGSNLGQFHCDFPPINGHDEMPWSIEAFFLMKKMYIHKITDSSGEIDYVIRGKGVTLKSILYLAEEQFEGDVMKLYEALYNGETKTFDLTKGQPCFQLNKNMTVTTLNEFKRKIKKKL